MFFLLLLFITIFPTIFKIKFHLIIQLDTIIKISIIINILYWVSIMAGLILIYIYMIYNTDTQYIKKHDENNELIKLKLYPIKLFYKTDIIFYCHIIKKKTY